MTFGKILLTLSPFGQSLEGRLEDTFKAAALHLSKLMRANFPDKCDIAQVFKKWNVHQLAYYDVHQITTPDGSCSKLHFHEWCIIIIIFWWYTYWNNAYESQLWFFSLFWILHDRSLHSCPSLHVGRIMPVTNFWYFYTYTKKLLSLFLIFRIFEYV